MSANFGILLFMEIKSLLNDITTRSTELGEKVRNNALIASGFILGAVGIQKTIEAIQWDDMPLESPGKLALGTAASALGIVAIMMTGKSTDSDPIPLPARIKRQGES